MSAEGIGMGGVAGVGGIATGSGIGTAAGISAGGGIGLEGGSIGIGSLGPSASVGIAEIGAAPSFSTAFSEIGSSVNSFAGSDALSFSPSPFSMGTSIPGVEAPFQMSNYQVLWSANSTQDISPAPTFGQPFEISVSTINSTPSDAMNADGMFADIGNFMNQNPAVSETPQSMFSDIDTFLRNDTELSPKIEGSIVETESRQDASLSAVEQASLLGLMARIKLVAPEVSNEHPANEHEELAEYSPLEGDPGVQIIDATGNSVDDTFLNEPGTLSEAALSDAALIDSTKSENTQIAVVEEGVVGDNADFLDNTDNPVLDRETENEITTGLATKSLPGIISEEEITADTVQAEKIIDLLGTIRDLDEETVSTIREAALGVLVKRHSGVSKQVAVVAEIEPDPEEQAEQTAITTAASPAVDTQTAVETLTNTAQASVVKNETEDIVKEPEPDEEPEEKEDEETSQQKKKTAIRDETRNTERVGKITKAYDEASKEISGQLEAAGHEADEVTVPGEIVAQKLVEKGIEADEKVRSEILSEEDQDGSLVQTINAVAAKEFKEDEVGKAAEDIVKEHSAVAVGHDPEATEEQIREVLDQKARKNVVVFDIRSRFKDLAA